MITHIVSAGAVVKSPEGLKGLVTGWVDEGDQRECGVIMRMGPGKPFTQFWIPYKTFVEDFTVIGRFEDEEQ